MFEVGFTEIALIFVIALLVLGPQRLPKLAADIGRWAGRARSMARQLRSQLEQEAQFDPVRNFKFETPPEPAGRPPDQTIHTPPPPPPEPAQQAAAAAPDTNDAPRPG
jgi:sec-independent protein translocase protein TatB